MISSLKSIRDIFLVGKLNRPGNYVVLTRTQERATQLKKQIVRAAKGSKIFVKEIGVTVEVESGYRFFFVSRENWKHVIPKLSNMKLAGYLLEQPDEELENFFRAHTR